ncbi:MAG: hypothetical protein PHE88_10005 [Elusimicrobia bacterium]|nr:hypothetical protein [Elusimicrobiota bacterium]
MQHILELPKVDFITNVKGKPKSVILNFADWKRIVETLKIISSKELRQSINRAKTELCKSSKLFSIKELSNL